MNPSPLVTAIMPTSGTRRELGPCRRAVLSGADAPLPSTLDPQPR
jgi:hypothetical protein